MIKTPLKYGGSRSSAPAILTEKRAMKREKSVFKQNRERNRVTEIFQFCLKQTLDDSSSSATTTTISQNNNSNHS